MSDNEMKQMESVQVPAAVADRPKGGINRPLTALLLAVAMVVSIGAAAWVGMTPRSPLDRVLRAAENSLAAYERNPAAALMNRVSEGGSAELLWDVRSFTQSLLGIGWDAKVSVKLYYDTFVESDPRTALTTNVELAGSPLFDLLLTASGDHIALASGPLFGEEAYGIDLAAFWDNFDSSAFGPGGEYSLGMSAAELKEELRVLEDSEAMTEAAVPAVTRLLAAFRASLEEHAVIEEGEYSYPFSEKETELDTVAIYLDGTGVVGMFLDMLEFMRTNQAMKDFLYEYADTMSYSYLDENDGAMAVDEFYAALDSMTEEDLKAITEDPAAEKMRCDVLFAVNPDNEQLVGLFGLFSSGTEEISMNIMAGPDWGELDSVSFHMDDGYNVVDMNYIVAEDSADRFAAYLTVAEDGVAGMEGALTWDKKGGSYTARITDGYGDSYGADGTLTADDDGAVLTIDTVRSETAYGDVEEGGGLGLSLILRADDDMPDTPGYTDVLTMTADELEGLGYQLKSVLSGMGELLSLAGF